MSPTHSNGNGSRDTGSSVGDGSARGPIHEWPVRRFGARREFDVPDLVDLQTRSYAQFLQEAVPQEHREDFGLEGIYGSRKTLAGKKGDEFRMNFLARYYIN